MAEHDVLAELGNDAHAVHIVNMTVIPEDVFASVLKEAAAVPPGIAVLVGLALSLIHISMCIRDRFCMAASSYQ